MAHRGKWIDDSTPDQPVTAVASRALGDRLGMVWHYAPRAARHADDDAEYVHQLRVSTRRAVAALNVFDCLLPPRRAGKLRRLLRRVRRAASDARDLDVLAQQLAPDKVSLPPQNIESVADLIAEHRELAQGPLVAAYRRMKRLDFPTRVRRLVKRVRWRGDGQTPALATVAAGFLAGPANDFLAAARADLSDVNALHRMRISGKRLRYTMELVAGAYGDSFRQRLYSAIAQTLERLGAVNDHATARQAFTCLRAENRNDTCNETLARLIEREHEQLERSCDRFRQWWTDQKLDELHTRFRHYLAHG